MSFKEYLIENKEITESEINEITINEDYKQSVKELISKLEDFNEICKNKRIKRDINILIGALMDELQG